MRVGVGGRLEAQLAPQPRLVEAAVVGQRKHELAPRRPDHVEEGVGVQGAAGLSPAGAPRVEDEEAAGLRGHRLG